ncbi:hypothetical protein BKA57DRAFT_388679 [Linnemannia elongata]|nr:hypothetical protein BKA57DRAFT_388679 [Linnemannia elongata]
MRNEHQVQEEMGVPGNLVGLIIGRGGENLKRIERETGCKVQFSQDGNSNDRERFVNIVGQPAGIADARRQIQEIITSSQTGERPGGYGGFGGGGNYGMGGGDGYGRGGSSSTIQIPSTKVGLVIGRRGETIRDLQDRSGARIAVTPTPQDHNSPSRTVTITGDDSAIERAKTFIDEIVNDMAPRGAYGGGGFQNTPPVTMTVPQESIGLVIGRGGETVKQLQIQSRAKIQVQQVDPSEPAPAERTINLFGPPEAVEYAKQLIMEKVNGAVSFRDSFGNVEKWCHFFLVAFMRRYFFHFCNAMIACCLVLCVLVWKKMMLYLLIHGTVSGQPAVQDFRSSVEMHLHSGLYQRQRHLFIGIVCITWTTFLRPRILQDTFPASLSPAQRDTFFSHGSHTRLRMRHGMHFCL